MHHDSFRIRADDAPDFVANANWHVPPAFGPRPYPTRGPDVGVLMQSIVSGARHRPETVRDQVDCSFEDRKLRTPFKKVVSQDDLRLDPDNLPQLESQSRTHDKRDLECADLSALSAPHAGCPRGGPARKRRQVAALQKMLAVLQ